LQVVKRLTTRRRFLPDALVLSGALSMLPLLAPDGHLTFIVFRRQAAAAIWQAAPKQQKSNGTRLTASHPL
jgi:hypothetical protein